ncbi:hypothetical protein KIN20_030757, partial [Parelaphostrongylus tenuis]
MPDYEWITRANKRLEKLDQEKGAKMETVFLDSYLRHVSSTRIHFFEGEEHRRWLWEPPN